MENIYFCNEWDCPYRVNEIHKEKEDCDLVFDCHYDDDYCVNLGKWCDNALKESDK